MAEWAGSQFSIWRERLAIKIISGKIFSRYSGCHKYVPFAGFPNRSKCNV
jgi:hypothetical protein